MSLVTREAWKSAERRAFDFFLSITGYQNGTEEVNQVNNKEGNNRRGYIGQFPLAASTNNELGEWVFYINGGQTDHYVQPAQRTQVVSWRMNSMFVGRFTDRDEALDMGSLLIELLPAGGSTNAVLKDIQQITLTEKPSVEPGVIELGNISSNTAGGMTRIWILTAPMWTVFDTTNKVA